MWSTLSVDLVGHEGRAIHNRLYRHDPQSDCLTVIIAGFAYTPESPYLFYSKHAPFALGSDVLAIDFEYSRNAAFLLLPDEEKDAWFHEDIRAIKDYLLGAEQYPRLSLIGKSLGTTAEFLLLQDPETREKTARAAWLTPGEKRREIAELLLADALPSLVVYGASDPYADGAPVDQLRACAHVDVLVVPDADHALECPTPAESLQHLGEYLTRLQKLFQ